jgi:hypothetical protein
MRIGRAHHSLEENLDAPSRGLGPHYSRGYHPGVIEYEQIARPQIRRQILHAPIRNGPGLAIQHQQPTRRPLGQGTLGDQLFGKVI